MISLANTGKRLDNIVSYIKNQSPQDTWIIDSIVPLFLEVINQNLSSQEEKLIISKVNQLIDSYEFRYGKIFENNSLITEVSDETLDLQQKFFNDMLVNKSKIVQRYGKDAERVMKGKAMNLAKKETEKMEKQKIKELVRKSLMDEAEFSKEYDDNPALKGGQKKLPDALQKSIIDKKEVKEAYGEEVESLALTFKDPNEFEKAKQHFESNSDFYPFDISDEFKTFYFQVEDQADADSTEFYLNQELEGETDLQGYYFSTESSPLSEDLDLGHEDNEPHMIKGELYKIGKYAMELYQMVDSFEGKGEVDFPAWWQAKITKACSMIGSAKHYLEFELKEPEIDAMVGVAADEDILSEIEVGDMVKIKKEYGGGKGKVTNKKGSFIIINGKSYHESDVVKSSGSLEEKKLTKAEKSKKEDIVKGMKKSFKGDESAMYAIATAKAKKVAETITKKLKEGTGLKKGDTVEFEGKKYKIGSFDTEANLVYLNTMDNKPAEDSKGSYLKVHATKAKKVTETLYNPGEMYGEYEIGDIVSYNGEDHEVTRVEGDRIYIRPSEASAILGKKPAFWVKKDDLND